MRKTIATQFLSILTSATLLIPSFIGSASAIGAPGVVLPDFVKAMAPSEDLGYVASSFDAGGAKKPRLIVISDLHAHLGVQRNIMGILDKLVPTVRGSSGSPIPVFLEGGWLPNLEEPLRGFSNPNIRSFMNEYYLHKAELGGAQAYSEKVAGTHQVTLIGVEDKEEYLANKAIFAKSYPARKQVLEAIQFQEAAIGLLQNSVEGRSFKKLQAMQTSYNDGRLSADRYAKSLVRYADRFHIEGRYVSVLKNLATANPSDVEIAFAQVYRAVSAQLSENRPWTSYLRVKLPNEDAVRTNLSKVTADMDLLKRLVANQLTPSEVTLAMSRIGDLEKTAALLLKDQPVTVGASDVIRQSLEFYPLAFVRDETLVKNSLKSLAPFGSEATGILVAGGFHTDAIAQYLKERQIPYMVIHPNVDREITTNEELNYVKRMGNEHVSIQELKSDLDKIHSGRLSQGTGSAASATGVMQNTVVPGTVKDQFFGGYPAVVAAVNAMDMATDPVAHEQAVKELDAALTPLGLDINNLDQEKVSLEIGPEGIYHEVGVEGPSSVADIVNEGMLSVPLAARPHTVHIDAIPDVEAARLTGGVSDYQSLEDGKVGLLRLAVSHLQQIKALAHARPEAGTQAEANAIRAMAVVHHELKHGLGQSEANTTAIGLATVGHSVETHLGHDAVSRIADAVLPQLQAGQATKAAAEGLGQKLRNVFTPDTFKSHSVQEIAASLAQEIPGSTPEQIAQLMSSYEGTMDMTMARAGVTAGLRKRIQNAYASMRASGVAA